MKLWIRVDAASPHDPKFSELATRLGVRPAEAYGCCVAVWCAMSEHALDADLSAIDDRTLERWAIWDGRKGRFAKEFRALFMEGGTVKGWRERQGKLAEQMERDRKRHRTSSKGASVEDAVETPRRFRGNSGATVRNVTEQKDLTPSPLPVGSGEESGSGDALPETPAFARPPQPKAAKVGRPPRPLTDDERAVLEHYKSRHPKRKPDKDRKILNKLRAALESHSVAELCRAIDGNAEDPWYKREGLQGLGHVLKDADTIDTFIAKRETQEDFTKPWIEKDPARAYTMGVVA